MQGIGTRILVRVRWFTLHVRVEIKRNVRACTGLRSRACAGEPCTRTREARACKLQCKTMHIQTISVRLSRDSHVDTEPLVCIKTANVAPLCASWWWNIAPLCASWWWWLYHVRCGAAAWQRKPAKLNLVGWRCLGRSVIDSLPTQTPARDTQASAHSKTYGEWCLGRVCE